MSAMIVVGGESLIDLIVHPNGRVSAIPGGGPFNTARTIGRLGGSAAYLGRISTDRFGRSMLDRLRLDGVDCRLVQTTDAPTTLAVVPSTGRWTRLPRRRRVSFCRHDNL